jgi:D-inositol-3-phosphate glycosyltransferase
VHCGPVMFTGWALAGSNTPAAVGIIVNQGSARMSARVGHDRPDVPFNLEEPWTTAACGWAALVDLAFEPAGDLRVQVMATDASGRHRVVADRLFALRGAGLSGAIDAPVRGAILEDDLLVVAGWASSVGGLASIDVELGEVLLGQARLGLPRLDVYEQAQGRYGPICGFEFRGSIAHVKNGVHELSISIVDETGHRSCLESLPITLARAALCVAEQEIADKLQKRTVGAIDRAVTPKRVARRDLLVFTHSLALGGGELYLQDLLRGVLPALNRCTLISPTDGVLSPGLDRLGVDVVVRGPRRPDDLMSYEGAIRELALFIRASGCSSVLLNTITEWMAADAAQRAGVPTIWAIHESFEPCDWMELNFPGSPARPYFQARLEASLRNASRLIFEADAAREIYVRLGVPETSALTVPYGIDIDAIDAYTAMFDRDDARRRHGLPVDATVLLCMGVFQERKSQAWLVEAFERVSKAHPGAVLVLVGDHPSQYSAAVHAVIDAAALDQRIRTVPITSDIWEWYALADLLVSASDVESLPRSILEAMAFGCPVLASSVYGIPELITDGETGWLMRPRDTAALGAGLHRVLGLDGAVRRSVSAAGRELVRTSHRAEGYAARYLQIIDELEGAG